MAENQDKQKVARNSQNQPYQKEREDANAQRNETAKSSDKGDRQSQSSKNPAPKARNKF